MRTSSDSGLPDEKCSSSKSSSVSSSSSNLSTGSPTQPMAPVDPRMALSYILEAVGDVVLLDDVEKVSSADVRKRQKDGSFRRHSDEIVSPRVETLPKDTKSEEVICVTNVESHTAANEAANNQNKSHQLKTSDKRLMSTYHVQSTETMNGKKLELNGGANSGARHHVDIKNFTCTTSEISATKSTNCDNVRPSAAAAGSHKTNTVNPGGASTRTASLERKMQSNSNVPVKTYGSVAVRTQPSLVKTKQVLARTPQPERHRPKVKQIVRLQPSGLKPQVTSKMHVQGVPSTQQYMRTKAQQRLSEAARSTTRKESPMVPPRLKKHNISSISPAIQQLQRTPQKKFVPPTTEQQHARTNKPELLSDGKIPDAGEPSDVTAGVHREKGAVRKSGSLKEVGSLATEQKQLSSSAGSVLLTGKLLSDGSRLEHDPTGQKHLRIVHHGEQHTVLNADVEIPTVVKSAIRNRPATAVVAQCTHISVEPLDNASDPLKQHVASTSVVVEHTGPIIQDAFESLNKKKAEEARALLERQRQQLLKPKSPMKSRPSSSVKKPGAKSESRPVSVRKSAKTKATPEDALGKGRKGKAGKKGKSKKKGAANKETSDEPGDNFLGDTDLCLPCDNTDNRGVTVVQSQLSLSSSGVDSDDEYLFSKNSYYGSDLSEGVRSQHRMDIDQTLPGQATLVEPVEELSLLPEYDSVVEDKDLYKDVETILDEVVFGVDDEDTLTGHSCQSSESLRLLALKQSPLDEQPDSGNPLRQTDQAIKDFEGTVTNMALDEMLETARSEKEDPSPEVTRTDAAIANNKDPSSKPPEAEKPEEEDVNKIIEEILKSTPDPSKSMSLKFKERKRRKGSGRKSKTMEGIAKELQSSQERTFRQLPTHLSHADDASSELTLTQSYPKDDHSDPDKSSSSGELEAEQMKKLMNTVKRLQLRVDVNAEASSGGTKQEESLARRPPPGPKGMRPPSASQLAQDFGARRPEKSPRFVRRHENFCEIKDAAGSRRQSVSKVGSHILYGEIIFKNCNSLKQIWAVVILEYINYIVYTICFYDQIFNI